VDNKGELGWEPGANRYEFEMASEFQKIAEGKGALVSTGTSGTAYGILHSAQLIGAKSGADVVAGVRRQHRG
jgi:hypothetical protein